VCSQELEVVAESPGTIGTFAIDDTNAYWTSGPAPASIYKAPKSGGTPVLVASNTNASPMVTNGQDIVFRDSTTNTLKRVSVNGGAITTLTTLGYYLTDIGIDSTYIYWNDQTTNVPNNGPTHVYRMPIAGGSPTLVATGQYSSRGWITVDGTNIYIMNDGPDYPGSLGLKHYGSIKIIPKGASGVNMDFSPSFSTVFYLGETKYFNTFGQSVAVNDTHIFIHSMFANGGQGVVRATKGTLQTQFLGNGWTDFMAADASYLYTRLSSGVRRMSVNGGTQNEFAEFNEGGGRIFLDATHAYWRVSSIKSVPFHAIMRAEK